MERTLVVAVVVAVAVVVDDVVVIVGRLTSFCNPVQRETKDSFEVAVAMQEVRMSDRTTVQLERQDKKIQSALNRRSIWSSIGSKARLDT
jgi:hypothetical protein